MTAREPDSAPSAADPARPGIFLAFVQEDAPRAASVDAALRAAGARTAFDEQHEFENGLPSEPVLQDLGACDVFMVLQSQHSADDAGISELRRLAASFDKPCLDRSLDEAEDQAVVAAVYQFLGVHPEAPAPRPHLAVEPGHWRITSDAQHGESLDLELAATGHLAGVHHRAGVDGKVTGRWRSPAEEGELDLDLESSFGLRPTRVLRRLRLLSGTNDDLAAEDLHGIATVLHYRLIRD